METHGVEIAALRSNLVEVTQNVECNSASFQGFQNEFNSERDARTKLGARVDQCYKYFNGLGKGLQETQRQILNSEGSTLPPKIGGGAMLPTLPTMPKTPRGSLPTPRKAKAP